MLHQLQYEVKLSSRITSYPFSKIETVASVLAPVITKKSGYALTYEATTTRCKYVYIRPNSPSTILSTQPTINTSFTHRPNHQSSCTSLLLSSLSLPALLPSQSPVPAVTTGMFRYPRTTTPASAPLLVHTSTARPTPMIRPLARASPASSMTRRLPTGVTTKEFPPTGMERVSLNNESVHGTCADLCYQS